MAKIRVAVEIEDAFGVQEAADKLKIGIATAWRWIKNGRLASFRIGGRTLVPGDSIRQAQKGRDAESQASLPDFRDQSEASRGGESG